MSTADLKRLLKIRVFRRDEKERVYSQARNYLNACKLEKQNYVQAYINTNNNIPLIMSRLYEKAKSRALSGQEWAIAQFEQDQSRNSLVQLEHFIQKADAKCNEAADKMEVARLNYLTARKEFDRLETMIKELDEQDRIIEEIMSEANDDTPFISKNRCKKPIRGIKKRR